MLQSTLARLICAPAVPSILSDLGYSNASYITILVSIWELGEACGPLLIAPLSEMFGRAPVYHAANVMFVGFALGSGFSTNIQMLVALRFFIGLAVASVTLDPGVIGDIFAPKQRGKAMALANLPPLIGPIAGPIIGGYMSQAIGWRWTFWLPAILGAFVECGFIILFRETYKVTIIQRKVRRLRRERNNPALQSAYGDLDPGDIFSVAILRPLQMLLSSSALFVLSMYVAAVFGYLYLLLTSITETFQTRYGFSTGSTSLTFLGLGISLLPQVGAGVS